MQVSMGVSLTGPERLWLFAASRVPVAFRLAGRLCGVLQLVSLTIFPNVGMFRTQCAAIVVSDALNVL